MPRDSNGLYTLPAGNPVAAGTVIEVAWANPTMEDLRLAMTDSLDRFGRGGMSAPLALSDGSEASPAMTWSTEQNSGLYRSGTDDLRFAVGGSDITRWLSSGFEFWDGTAWRVPNNVTVETGTTDGQMLVWATDQYAKTDAATIDGAGNMIFTGNVTALSYSGDGSALTGIVSANGVPIGGTTGQVLVKDSNGDFDTSWAAPGAAPVDSVFARTGAVVAEVGDYSAFYLGLTDAATDSNNLGGNNPAFYLDADNIDAGTLDPARMTGSYNIDITGTAGSVVLAADSSKLNSQTASFYQNADNMNDGFLPPARLSGTYPCNITGSAGSAASATNCSRSVLAGVGLVGGGALTANVQLNIDDQAVVLTATNQTITGIKNHTATLRANAASLPLEIATLPSTTTGKYMRWEDAGGFKGYCFQSDSVAARDVATDTGAKLRDVLVGVLSAIGTTPAQIATAEAYLTSEGL